MKHEYRAYKALDINWLHKTFRYDETTGLLYNRRRRSKSEEGAFVGRCNPDGYQDVMTNWEEKDSVAGHINKAGYRVVIIGWKSYQQHIIIWMLAHKGKLPKYKISRRNGDISDNRLTNLVDTKHPICYSVYGVSKYRGVQLISKNKYYKWRAQIRIEGRIKTIDSFETEIEAAHAYDNAARKVGRDEQMMNFPKINGGNRNDNIRR